MCEDKIPNGSWRCEYVLKPSSKLSDTRHMHAACASMLPAETMEHDQRVVGDWARVADLILDAQRVLGELVAALHVEAGQPAAGAAAPSAAGAGQPAAGI